MSRCLRLACLCLAFGPVPVGRAVESVSVAAAANLVFALEEVHTAYLRAEPTVQLQLVIGASGNLVGQIRNGAPYDVFLSADLEFARRLVDDGHADSGSLAIFALGRLVLWTARSDLGIAALEDLRSTTAISRVAIANPETAPYGRVAREALIRLNLWDALQRKLVFGESIAQTLQYVETGNAEVGLVALSLVLAPRLRGRGHWIEIPQELYTPLEQALVLTKRGTGNPAAARYVAFLRSATAGEIFARFGYAPAQRTLNEPGNGN